MIRETMFRMRYACLFFIKYLTIEKLLNLIKCNYAFYKRRTTVFAYPYKMVIDTSNVCNLSCPHCYTGIKKYGRGLGFMGFDDFKIIFDKIYKHVFVLALFNWSEPFLNKNIFDIIKYCKVKKVGTVISSNFNVINEGMFEKIIDSGLDHLIVSIDGTTQDSYSKYRVGGNIEKVLHNVRELVNTRRKKRVKHPYIQWQFIVNKYNEHEINNAKIIAKKLGVDSITFHSRFGLITGIFEYDEKEARKWLSDKKEFAVHKKKFPVYKTACHWLWKAFVVNYDGSVAPCCGVIGSDTDFDNIINKDFFDVWNNEKFRAARSLFVKTKDLNVLNVETICSKCGEYKKV